MGNSNIWNKRHVLLMFAKYLQSIMLTIAIAMNEESLLLRCGSSLIESVETVG